MEWIPALSPTSCVSGGASPEVQWNPPLFWKRHIQSLPDIPQEFCSMASSTTLWMEWIPALSPTRWNVQTTTKSFVDKRRPQQNGVPDQHVGNKLSFQVNWTLWIISIALSSSDHPSSIQNHWSIQSGFPLSPQRHVFQGCISRSAVKSSIVVEASHLITSRLPPGVLLNGIYVGFWRRTSTNSYLL